MATRGMPDRSITPLYIPLVFSGSASGRIDQYYSMHKIEKEVRTVPPLVERDDSSVSTVLGEGLDDCFRSLLDRLAEEAHSVRDRCCCVVPYEVLHFQISVRRGRRKGLSLVLSTKQRGVK